MSKGILKISIIGGAISVFLEVSKRYCLALNRKRKKSQKAKIAYLAFDNANKVLNVIMNSTFGVLLFLNIINNKRRRLV